MIWNSTPLMTLIDLVILAITGASAWVIFQQRRDLKAAGAFRALIAILLGLGIISAFYVADLWTMHVLPRLTSPMGAMQTMEYLHLDWQWLVVVTAVMSIFGSRRSCKLWFRFWQGCGGAMFAMPRRNGWRDSEAGSTIW